MKKYNQFLNEKNTEKYPETYMPGEKKNFIYGKIYKNEDWFYTYLGYSIEYKRCIFIRFGDIEGWCIKSTIRKISVWGLGNETLTDTDLTIEDYLNNRDYKNIKELFLFLEDVTIRFIGDVRTLLNELLKRLKKDPYIKSLLDAVDFGLLENDSWDEVKRPQIGNVYCYIEYGKHTYNLYLGNIGGSNPLLIYTFGSIPYLDTVTGLVKTELILSIEDFLCSNPRFIQSLLESFEEPSFEPDVRYKSILSLIKDMKNRIENNEKIQQSLKALDLGLL